MVLVNSCTYAEKYEETEEVETKLSCDDHFQVLATQLLLGVAGKHMETGMQDDLFGTPGRQDHL